MEDRPLHQVPGTDPRHHRAWLPMNLKSLPRFVGHGTCGTEILYGNVRRFSSRYYHQEEDAGRLMTQTLATLPPSQRAPFSRLQASIRSAYHRSVNARRTAEFQAHLSATQPGGSLMPHSRSDPRGTLARKGVLYVPLPIFLLISKCNRAL